MPSVAAILTPWDATPGLAVRAIYFPDMPLVVGPLGGSVVVIFHPAPVISATGISFYDGEPMTFYSGEPITFYDQE